MKNEIIERLIIDSESAFMEGNSGEAVNLSGEALALSDNLWTNDLKNNHKATRANTLLLARCGVAHCRALASVGLYSESFTTATALLFQISVADSYTFLSNTLRIDLIFLAFTGILSSIEQGNLRQDDFTREHVGHILCYLYSMLYASYRDSNVSSTPAGLLKATFDVLKENEGKIPCLWPDAVVNGKRVSYTSPGPLLADILGRARALGFLEE